MKNIGKVFEEQIEKSVPDNALLHRLPDSAQAFGRSKKMRFSNKSPFDYIMWDSHSHTLYALELKTVSEISIPFERDESEHCSGIHYHQIQSLNKWNQYDGIVCGFIIEFRKLEKTIFLEISNFNSLMDCISKKSFRISDLDSNNIPYVVIPQKKLIVNYLYDMDYFIQSTKLR